LLTKVRGFVLEQQEIILYSSTDEDPITDTSQYQ
jgi:hypothetical protein